MFFSFRRSSLLLSPRPVTWTHSRSPEAGAIEDSSAVWMALLKGFNGDVVYVGSDHSHAYFRRGHFFWSYYKVPACAAHLPETFPVGRLPGYVVHLHFESGNIHNLISDCVKHAGSALGRPKQSARTIETQLGRIVKRQSARSQAYVHWKLAPDLLAKGLIFTNREEKGVTNVIGPIGRVWSRRLNRLIYGQAVCMKTQIHISKTGTEAIVIDVIDDESIHVDVRTHPNQFMPEPTAPTFAVTGLRWRDGKHYHLAWVNRPLNLGDSILIEYSNADAPPTALEKESEYIAPEDSCSFCHKPASEVEFLVKRSPLARICSDCVQICQTEIDNRRQNRDPG